MEDICSSQSPPPPPPFPFPSTDSNPNFSTPAIGTHSLSLSLSLSLIEYFLLSVYLCRTCDSRMLLKNVMVSETHDLAKGERKECVKEEERNETA